MGLDMYLTARRYFFSYSPEETALAKEVSKAIGAPAPVKEVALEAAYWRKANQIHGWFVDNVQDGEDECRPHEVDRSKLEELLNICKKIKADPDKACQLLPTRDGFFFGSTEIDDWYMQDIEETIRQIEPLLTDSYKDYWFEYRSSW